MEPGSSSANSNAGTAKNNVWALVLPLLCMCIAHPPFSLAVLSRYLQPPGLSHLRTGPRFRTDQAHDDGPTEFVWVALARGGPIHMSTLPPHFDRSSIGFQ